MRCFLMILGLSGFTCAADSGITFFEKKIRPVLIKHCYECHSADAVKKGKVKGGLQLDTRTGMGVGGDTGPAVVPMRIEESLILFALRQEKNLEMPPKGKLPDAVIADFERWIEMGAPDPRDGEMAEVVKADDFAAARDFWSFKPLVTPRRPQVQDTEWAESELDFFVVNRREQQGLPKSENAAARTIIRRLYYDLIGLPPTPDEMRHWRSRLEGFRKPDKGIPQYAVAEVVDELLASRHFGERWGRHWLDVARYSDSNGRARNVLWHHAWRYRDWVINAFNRDIGFNNFIKHQVAGDLVAQDGFDQDSMYVAAGFLALGPKSVEESKKVQFTMDVIDEQIDTITRGFLGLSVACARCHDHKFDPVPTADYYALAGILHSTHTQYGYGPPHNWNINNDAGYRAIGPDVEKLLPAAAEFRKTLIAKIRERGKARSDRYRVVRRKADAERKSKTATGETAKELSASIEKMAAEIKEWDDRIKKMEEGIAALQADIPAQPGYAMSVRDKERPGDCRIYIRGEVATPGEKVARGNLRFLDIPGIDPIADDESGRRQLAEWVASYSNPLTPRVYVNRVWKQLFGRGLVTTPDDFGKTGAKPSHPELLDHLASQFVAYGWSVKRLIRTIVLSRTYRMSSAPNPEAQAKDPENRWLWRMTPRRLEVEPFRDAVLAISGQLNREPLERSVIAGFKEFEEFEFNTKVKLTQEQMRMNHRSVYLPIARGNLPEMLELFDFADPETLTGTRNETTVPAQSLFLMNGEWIIAQAGHLVERLGREAESDSGRLRRLFELAYGRTPTQAEEIRGLKFIGEGNAQKQWRKLCQSVLASSEFRYVQ